LSEFEPGAVEALAEGLRLVDRLANGVKAWMRSPKAGIAWAVAAHTTLRARRPIARHLTNPARSQRATQTPPEMPLRAIARRMPTSGCDVEPRLCAEEDAVEILLQCAKGK
jgi:hypothetical protein